MLDGSLSVSWAEVRQRMRNQNTVGMIATTILLAVPGHRGTERGTIRVDRLGIQARVAGIVVVVGLLVGDFGRDPGFGNLSCQSLRDSRGGVHMYVYTCVLGRASLLCPVIFS